MTTRSIAATLVLLLATITTALARHRDEPEPGIEELDARRAGDRVLVSYRLTGLLPDEVLERIHSGIPLRFRHKIEIIERRPGLFVADRVHARTIVDTTVTYDSLTQRYELGRSIEVRGRGKGREAETREQGQLADSEPEMRRWLTEMQEIPVFDPVQPIPRIAGLMVRLEVALGRRWILLIVPTTQTITAELELKADG